MGDMSTEGRVTVYGTPWCGDCWRTKRFLHRHGVPYNWVDIDQDTEARAHALALQGGTQTIPVVVFPDGGYLVEPTDAQLAARLGLPGS